MNINDAVKLRLHQSINDKRCKDPQNNNDKNWGAIFTD